MMAGTIIKDVEDKAESCDKGLTHQKCERKDQLGKDPIQELQLTGFQHESDPGGRTVTQETHEANLPQ